MDISGEVSICLELDVNTKEKIKAQILWNKAWSWSQYFWLGGLVDPMIFTWGLILNQQIAWAELDSSVEAADNQLNLEFRKKVEEIIDREYWYRENKSVYEKKIIDFIKNNNQWKDWYVEIPEYLAIETLLLWSTDTSKSPTCFTSATSK